MLKAAIITDIHAGPDVYGSNGVKIKSGSHAPNVVDAFVSAVNHSDVDCVLELGDRISGHGVLQDTFYMTMVQRELDLLEAPLYYIPGNNEPRYLSAEQIEHITGQTTETYSDVVNGIHVVFWNPVINPRAGLEFSESELEELKTTLDKHPNAPTIVCAHVPIDNDSESNPNVNADDGMFGTDLPYRYFHYVNAHEARKIIEDHGNVVMCLSGHQHKNKHNEINGVHYVTIDSPTALRKPDMKAMGTYALCEINPEAGRAEIDIRGGAPDHFSFEF